MLTTMPRSPFADPDASVVSDGHDGVAGPELVVADGECRAAQFGDAGLAGQFVQRAYIFPT